MDRWHLGAEYQRIGDIMARNSPFFKMYTEYVKNFDTAVNLVNATYQKNQKFAAIMDEIHAMPECQSLSLQHHMLTPIQRIPRYVLLLKEYIKNLPDGSTDRADSESKEESYHCKTYLATTNHLTFAEALEQASDAAAHANNAMRGMEKFKKLLEVQETLGGSVDLVSPTRELVKEGKIVKISQRSGDHQDRYLYLVSCSLHVKSSSIKCIGRIIKMVHSAVAVANCKKTAR